MGLERSCSIKNETLARQHSWQVTWMSLQREHWQMTLCLAPHVKVSPCLPYVMLSPQEPTHARSGRPLKETA